MLWCAKYSTSKPAEIYGCNLTSALNFAQYYINCWWKCVSRLIDMLHIFSVVIENLQSAADAGRIYGFWSLFKFSEWGRLYIRDDYRNFGNCKIFFHIPVMPFTVGWLLVVFRINVDLAIFQPYLDLEAGDNQSLKIQVARPGIEPRSSCSASQELNHSATAAPPFTVTWTIIKKNKTKKQKVKLVQ